MRGKNSRARRISLAVVLPFALGCVWTVPAAQVSMTGDVLPPAALGSISPSGSGSTNDPYTYTFATAGGLDMAGWKIYGSAQNNRNVKLNLNGGSIVGTQSGTSFDLSCSTAVDYPADLTIENVGTIRIGKLRTCDSYSSDKFLARVGNVIIGANTTGGRAGKVEIAEILAYSLPRYGTQCAGIVSIFSTNDVLIWDGSTAGDVLTLVGRAGNGGDVTILHDGSFRANSIRAGITGDSSGTPGAILADGDVLRDGKSGTFRADAIASQVVSETIPGGNVTIRGYSGVTVGSISNYSISSWAYDGRGGNVAITNISGDIAVGDISTWCAVRSHVGHGGDVLMEAGGRVIVTGTIDTHSGASGGNVTLSANSGMTVSGAFDLSSYNRGNDGTLSLTTTVASSAITLADLNLGKMSNAVISPGSKCILQGDLIGFNTNVAEQTQLRMPAGRRLYYHPDRPNNLYLARSKYMLAAPDGTPATGGVLMPYASPGTVITIK